MARTFGTFTKGSETRVATDAGEAVSLRFNGWAEQAEQDGVLTAEGETKATPARKA